jgi:membrane-associated phospholipid phosphatase
VQGEIHYLLDLMRQERGIYLEETIAQADFASLYFFNLLGFSRGDKPRTARLIDMAVQIGLMAVCEFKDHFKRVRPSEICPGLFPLFGPPGHPAFPSGHATQSFLIWRCIREIAPRFGDQAKWLAKRIAKNRERLGLHYPSDSAAGRFLAQQLFSILKNDPLCTRFQHALGEAAAEW